MAQGLTSVFEVGANELSRDECIAMLADGTGLSEEAVAEVRKEWRLYKRWLDRINAMYRSIEHKELESIVGTFGFGGVCVAKAKPIPSRCSSVVHSKIGRRGAYALLARQGISDLNGIHAEFINNIGVPFADPELLFLNPASTLHYMWSDSSRSESPKDFSGMGGFCTLTGLAWYWKYDDAEREGMQSHITEMVARPSKTKKKIKRTG